MSDWLGRIYLARVPDDAGNPIGHDHPVMVFMGPNSAGDNYVIAISTSFNRPLGRFMIECPWDSDGNSVTGLDKECVLKCWWVIHMNQEDLKRYLGEMPTEIVEKAIEYTITAHQE